MSYSLFSPLTLRGLSLRNRIFVSPMCQYSSEDGMPSDWHLVHLGSRAVGGAACVMQEATAVTPEGRISPQDAGIWSEAHAEAYRPITRFIRENGAVAAIQLAHAGRKASISAPWDGDKSVSPAQGGWEISGPSALAFDDAHQTPHTLSVQEINALVDSFAQAAQLSVKAGFQLVEVHAAHGYLLHEFLSSLSNTRTDDYGGSLENRMRFPLAVAKAVRDAWPQEWPVLVRVSASDWTQGGWDIEQTMEFSRRLKVIGIDLIDCSSGGNVPHARIPNTPGYQVPFAKAIKEQAAIATGAVGLITKPEQAESIIANGEADIVLLARELLRDPYWPLHAAHELGAQIDWPKQYARAKPR